MTTSTLTSAIAMALAAGTAFQASAQTIEERVLRLEQENRKQAAAIEQQASTIAEQNQRLEGAPSRVKRLEEDLETKRAAGAGSGGWFEKIQIGGLIEVEGIYTAYRNKLRFLHVNLKQPFIAYCICLYLLLPISRSVPCCSDDQNRVFSAGFGATSAVALHTCAPESASAHGGSLVEESGA